MRDLRVIARLDVKGEHVINTIHLEGLRKVGSPNGLAQKYYQDGADEILLIDQVASLYQRGHLLELTRKFAENVFIPLTVGGGVASVEDARELLRSGADKIAVNTSATVKPSLITELASCFGSQCVVVSIQAKRNDEREWEVLRDGGRERTGLDVMEWATKVADLGAGELLVTSVDRDGTRKGFDCDLMARLSKIVNIPVIASGGFGAPSHAVEIMNSGPIDALATADYLHMGRGEIKDIKSSLLSAGFRVREDDK